MSTMQEAIDAPSVVRSRNESSAEAPTPHDGEFTMGQVVALTGVGEHAIRFYEREGLVAPVHRQRSSGHRRYRVSDVSRLHTLACLRALGMPLAEMRQYIDLTMQGSEAAPEALRILAEQRAALEEQMRMLRERVAYLDFKTAYWEALAAGDPQAATTLGREFAGRIRAQAARRSTQSTAVAKSTERE